MNTELTAEEAYSASIAAFNRDDDGEGVRLAGLAEALGDRRAKWCNMASAAYRRGDVDAAREWWQKAAELNCARALHNLGWLAELAGDSDQAVHLYELAADRGYASAALNLASHLYEHDLAEREVIERWYKVSADLGQPDAMSCLAEMAEEEGLEEEALQMHVTAARAGSQPSAKHLVQKADEENFAEYLQLAIAAGIQEYADTLRDWTEWQAAAEAAAGLDAIANLERGHAALDAGQLEAAYEYLATAILSENLTDDQRRHALTSLIRNVLIPSDRLIEAVVWTRLVPEDDDLREVGEEVRAEIDRRPAFRGLNRLPDNVTWQSAEATLAQYPDDTHQDRYNRYLAFAVEQRPGARVDPSQSSFVSYVRYFVTGAGPFRFKFRHQEYRLGLDFQILLASVIDYLDSPLHAVADELQDEHVEDHLTTFDQKCAILGQLWVDYRDDENLEDFFEYNDIGLPLAYALSAELAAAKPEGEKFINETWDMLLEKLDLDAASSWDSLEDLLEAANFESDYDEDDDEPMSTGSIGGNQKRMNIFGK